VEVWLKNRRIIMDEIEKARKRQPTGRLLADVLRKRKKKKKKKPTGRTLAKVLDRSKRSSPHR